MATEINAGRVAMVPKGEWSASTAYTRLDVVQYNGSSYVASQDSTGQNPSTATTYWQLLASGVDPSNYYTKNETNTKLGSKQDALVSGQNIKTVNGNSLLGAGNLELGELFVVRMTRNNSNSVYTADKSVSEIYEASYTNGKPVIAVMRDISNPVFILADCNPDGDSYVFSAIESNTVTTLRWQRTDDYTYELETMALQPHLVSGTNIKTVNNESLLGSGNVDIVGKSAYQSYVDTTTDSPVKTEAEWIASLKGEDGVSLGDVAIADNLTTDDATKVLSARQGYLLGQKVNDVDDVPAAGSEKFVKSGGVQNELALGAVYDVSAKNPTAGSNNDGKWESLSTLLSDANLNNLIPTSVRKGGMSIKFVQSSDNKYVQYRLMSDEWSTNESDWQGTAKEITPYSRDIAEVGSLYGMYELMQLKKEPITVTQRIDGYFIGSNGYLIQAGAYGVSNKIKMNAGDILIININLANGLPILAVQYDDNSNYFKVLLLSNSSTLKEYRCIVEEDCYVVLSYNKSNMPVVYKSCSSSISQALSISNKTNNVFKFEDTAYLSEQNWIGGYYYDGDGVKKENQKYRISSPIPVNIGDIITLELYSITGLCVAVYTDAEGNVLEKALVGDYSEIKKYSFCVKQTGYISISYFWNNNTNNYHYLYIDNSSSIKEIGKQLEGKISEVSDKFNELIDYSGKTNLIPTWINGYYYYINGEKREAEKYRISNPIPVSIGDIIILNLYGIKDVTASAVYTDENGNVIEVALIADYSGLKEYKFTVLRSGYISFCYFYNNDASYFNYAIKINCPIINEVAGKLEEGVNYTDDLLLDELSTQNPISKIKYTPGFTSIIRSWGFIGDSLCSGEMNYTDGSSIGAIDMYDYSWGQMLCRMTGATGYNFSYGGQYAKRWITALDEDSSIKRQPERCWDGAKENLKDAYIIALGENDRTPTIRALYTEGSVPEDIGIYDPATDTDTNANSFAGWMAGIIQRIKSVQPKAPIFLVTLPKRPGSDSSRVAYNNVIRGLATYFDNVFLIDMFNYAPDFQDNAEIHDYFFNSNHMNALGYQWIAYMFCTYIDWIIRNNWEKFRQQQFVGTEYEFNTNQ